MGRETRSVHLQATDPHVGGGNLAANESSGYLEKSGHPRSPQGRRRDTQLVRQMARDNPTWGAPRIHGELLKLDFQVSEPSVSRYMP